MPCKLCNGLNKRDNDDVRLAFDFTPDELARSAYESFGGRCDPCVVILEGVRQFESAEWSFQQDVKRVYARCREKHGDHTDSLLLELYFNDERSKPPLEFYSLQSHGMP